MENRAKIEVRIGAGVRLMSRLGLSRVRIVRITGG